MQATAIAYPVHGSPARMNVGNQEIPEVEPNFFSMPGSSFNEDTVDMSSNFFTQVMSNISITSLYACSLTSCWLVGCC